ncbi:TRAP dicarboxylate transporter, DctM subunit (fragment) [Candidatus Propionivibrio aalborgensis]|uniref:TRAP dicarboxylate transporter, DctM subunit n=2 Tax=Candidatus Propionivibrio aalborgensis TaxID=1860101 RepID=A0A1A8Y4E3_9RHOO
MYVGYIVLVSIFKPAWAPALPIEARTLRGSKLMLRVLTTMVPPLALIFLVLGTIFMGIATPTEGGAMGATGALIMALARRRLTWKLLKQGMESTAKLTTFVIFILIGARVFSLTFYAVDGHRWVEHLLTGLPGGQVGFLIVVNVLVFLLAFFLDFFELSFIIVPLLGPVADKLGIDLIWFGVLLAVNMQTSFMHPPFGFALFFLRSVAPPSIKTSDIYWGAIPFVCIQVIMVGLLIAFPQLVTFGLDKDAKVDLDAVEIDVPVSGYGSINLPPSLVAPSGEGAPPKEEDPNKAILDAMKQEQSK